LFRITGLESAGFDRFRHLFFRQQTWQIPRVLIVVAGTLQNPRPA
jgi:hypothetical protein